MKTKANLHRKWFVWILLIMLASFTNCQYQSAGFVLPKGDIEEGKKAFLELNCDNCHYTEDIAWAGDESYNDPKLELGGEVTTIKTYGELVTSVINPSHKISDKIIEDAATTPDGRSKMERYGYNYVMSVQELIDVVSFLQSEYELVVPDYHYPY